MRAKFYIYQPWLTLVARLILGGVLLAAGGLKIGNLQNQQWRFALMRCCQLV
jgi:uncharacterized membrane protein YphA (DoxX/SURF4 family)